MSEAHDKQADRLEREFDDMAHDSERLKGDIDTTRSDWEQKKNDESVPGAGADPIFGEDEGDAPPEDDGGADATLSAS